MRENIQEKIQGWRRWAQDLEPIDAIWACDYLEGKLPFLVANEPPSVRGVYSIEIMIEKLGPSRFDVFEKMKRALNARIKRRKSSSVNFCFPMSSTMASRLKILSKSRGISKQVFVQDLITDYEKFQRNLKISIHDKYQGEIELLKTKNDSLKRKLIQEHKSNEVLPIGGEQALIVGDLEAEVSEAKSQLLLDRKKFEKIISALEDKLEQEQKINQLSPLKNDDSLVVSDLKGELSTANSQLLLEKSKVKKITSFVEDELRSRCLYNVRSNSGAITTLRRLTDELEAKAERSFQKRMAEFESIIRKVEAAEENG